MLGDSAFGECAIGETLPPRLKPATTYGGRAAQLVMLLYFLERRDPELAEAFRATIQSEIERLRAAGRKRTTQDAAVQYIDDTKANWDDPDAPIPHTLIHEASEEKGYSVDRLKRVLRERGYSIERKR